MFSLILDPTNLNLQILNATPLKSLKRFTLSFSCFITLAYCEIEYSFNVNYFAFLIDHGYSYTLTETLYFKYKNVYVN